MIAFWSFLLATAAFILGYLVGRAEGESINSPEPTEHGGNPL